LKTDQSFESELRQAYLQVLKCNNKTAINEFDSSLDAIEEIKKRLLPQVSLAETEDLISHTSLGLYVQNVLGKRHGQNLRPGRHNCINAAMGFHGFDRLEPYQPIEFLSFLTEQTSQLHDLDDFKCGDLVVWWNRSGGSWDERKIVIEDIDVNAPDFPYGLIFDHVAVRVTKEIVFNKPNPSPSSEYRFDQLETASYPSKLGLGHEMTLHRVRPK
jgi:hypothetical protein